MHCIVLRAAELELLKELVGYLNGVFYVGGDVSYFDDSLHIELEPHEVTAFYGIRRAIRRAKQRR